MLSQAGVMMATFDKRGKVLAYYGTHMNTDAAKKFAKKEGLIESVQLDEGTMNFLFDSPLKAGAFAQRIMRDKLASEVDRYVDHGKRKEVVELITHPNNYEKNDILKLAKKYKGTVHSVEEDVQLDEERVPTYVIDRQSKKIVHGPTDTADAKLYMKKQVQPRKFMIRQIRGEAKKVGDTV